MEAKLQTEEGKEIYRQRKKIAEPIFGQIKFNLGFRRFRLRGLGKAGGELTLVCLVHNIRKIYATIMAKGGELHSLTRELQAAHNPAQRSGVLFQLKIGYGMRKAEVTG
jgi:ABC-2 type transport system ATP-binding protein/transposase